MTVKVTTQKRNFLTTIFTKQSGDVSVLRIIAVAIALHALFHLAVSMMILGIALWFAVVMMESFIAQGQKVVASATA